VPTTLPPQALSLTILFQPEMLVPKIYTGLSNHASKKNYKHVTEKKRKKNTHPILVIKGIAKLVHVEDIFYICLCI